METLLSHYDEGRLQRGRTYANTGRVAALSIVGSGIGAKVRGNYRPWYRVKLLFPPFTDQEREAVLALIRERPVLLAAVISGELPMELIDALKTAGIDLLPRDWGRLQRSCDCPDYGDPCKHMAAVYYVITREIDQNPFAIFLLRGLDLHAEFSLKNQENIPSPLVLQVRLSAKEGKAGETADPKLSLNDNYVSFILSVLRPSPPFWSGDFKTLLAEFYHESARRYELALTIPRTHGDASRIRLQDCDFCLSPDTPAEAGAPLKLRFKHPLGPTLSMDLFEATPLFLFQELETGSASYRYFFFLYRLFFLIIRAGAFIPAPMEEDGILTMAWNPLSSVQAIATQIGELGALCPPLLRVKTGTKGPLWADGVSTTHYLLCALCGSYVRSLGFLSQRGSGRRAKADPMVDLFFSGGRLETAEIAHRSTPRAIFSWVSVFSRQSDLFRYRFTVAPSPRVGKGEIGETRAYRLGVYLARKGESAWIRLHKASKVDDAVEAFALVSLLSGYLGELAALEKQASVGLSEERLLFFLKEAAPVLRRLGAEVVLPKELGRELKPRVVVGATLKGGGTLTRSLGLKELLSVDWKVAIGDSILDMKEFQALVKEGRRVVRFKDGFLSLDSDQVRRLLERAGRRPTAADAVAAFVDGGAAFSEEALAACETLLGDKETPVPEELSAQLRHYQLNGYRWAWNNIANGFGCLLADDMGLGKTVQAIAVTLKLKQEKRLKRGALVVVPASLMTNWRRELERFAPSLKVKDYYGPRRSMDAQADLHLSTYETVLRDEEKLSAQKFSLLVLDEAHGLKNAASKRAQALRSIKSDARLALSGTPVENRLEDLRAVMDLVLPGYLGDAASFRRTWRVPIELHRDLQAAEALKRATAPFLLRRLKTDPGIASDLPEKVIIDEYAKLSKAQAALYESVLTELTNPKTHDLEDPRTRGALVLKLLTALKQVCNHPRAYDGQTSLEVDKSGKARLLMDLLRGILEGGEKVLVFSQYVETLDLLRELIATELGEACLCLHGGLRSTERSRAVDRFQNDGSQRIFLISLKAGGVGLNLTAASRVIHYDLWFNPAVENQATDRAFRIGQARKVFVHRLISAGTFEEKIDALIKSKRELADLSVAQGESWLSDLQAGDIRQLFKRD